MRWICLALLFLLGCTTIPTAREPAFLGFSKAQKELTFDDLQLILVKNNFSRVKDLLHYLADEGSYRDYLSYHTFGFHSLSLQTSSFNFPRAIVYGTTASFIITFNGDPNDDGYESLETVQFNSATAKFEFREIKFLNDERVKQGLHELAFQRGFKISAINGPKELGSYLEDDLKTDPLAGRDPDTLTFKEGRCFTCHTNGRPIWTGYNKWPGFYGGEDDVFFFRLGSKHEFKTPVESVSETMRNNFYNFEKSKKGMRYEFLGDYGNDPKYHSPRPNGFLADLLFAQNGKRVLKILQENGPPVLSQHQCWELKNHDFTKAANSLNRINFDRYFEKFNDSAKETYDEKTAANLIAWIHDYGNSPKEREMLEKGEVYTDAYVTYAQLQYFFPQMRPETLATDLYESVYDFNTGGGMESLVPEEKILAFMTAAAHTCP